MTADPKPEFQGPEIAARSAPGLSPSGVLDAMPDIRRPTARPHRRPAVSPGRGGRTDIHPRRVRCPPLGTPTPHSRDPGRRVDGPQRRGAPRARGHLPQHPTPQPDRAHRRTEPPGRRPARRHCPGIARGGAGQRTLLRRRPGEPRHLHHRGQPRRKQRGPRAVKYGVTKDWVLNLEVVLADGTVIQTGADTLKNSTGYNLTQLMVGSEGTLGFITEATLKLLPWPRYNALLLVPFDDPADACRAVAGLFMDGLQPSALEFMERAAIELAMAFTGDRQLPLHADTAAHLLIEVDGFREEDLMPQLERIARPSSGSMQANRSSPSTKQPRTNCGTSAARWGKPSRPIRPTRRKTPSSPADTCPNCSPPSSASAPSTDSKACATGMPETATCMSTSSKGDCPTTNGTTRCPTPSGPVPRGH